MNGRRIVRWSMRVLGVVLVVALAVLLVLRLYGSHRLAAADREFAAKLGPIEGNPYASAKVPDEENAAIYLRAGSEAVILSKRDTQRAGELTTTRPDAWMEDDRTFMHRILADNAPPLELIHRAAAFPKTSFGLRDQRTDVFRSKVPLLKLLWAQRLLYLESCLALQEHDLARFLAAAGAMSTMAKALEQESPLIVPLVGVACEKMLLEATAEALATPDVDERSISQLEKQLVDVDLDRAWRRSLRSEFRLPAHAGIAWMANTEPNWAERLRYALLGGYVDAPYVERMTFLAGAMGTPFGDGLAERLNALSTSLNLPKGTPNLVNAVSRFQVVLSERRLARLALSLRRHASQVGTYPTSLATFPEGADRDPFTGGRIVYTLRPDGSAQLTVPNGVKLWDRLNPEVHNPGPFTWELPAPQSRAVRGAAS